MSDQTPNVTTESSANTALPLEKQEHGKPTWLNFWWIPLAFLVPFMVFWSYMGSYAVLNLAGCFRSGAVGLGVAALIYGLWRIDGRIGKVDDKELQSLPLVGMLGMMLWLGWVSAAHIIIVANDEVTTPSVMVDH